MFGLPTSMSVPGDDVGDFLTNRSNTTRKIVNYSTMFSRKFVFVQRGGSRNSEMSQEEIQTSITV